jgi:4-carboxymuconolactone decarboxylase
MAAETPRGGLDSRVRHLASIAVLCVAGEERSLAKYLKVALEGKVSVDQICEALLQVVPFAGFPRAIEGFHLFRGLLAESPSSAPPLDEGIGKGEGRGSKQDIREEPFEVTGNRQFSLVYGGQAGTILNRLTEYHPELAEWIIRDAYGKVLARPGLSSKDRELLAVAMLLALGLPRQLLGHMRGARCCGASLGEIREVISQTSLYIGEAETEMGLQLMEKLEQEIR